MTDIEHAKNMPQPSLILASLSPFRKIILENAGLDFAIAGAKIDERQVEQNFAKISPEELAKNLACAKAENVSCQFPQALVIGCDQTLDFDGQVLHKCASLDEAYNRLHALSGKTHYLHSGIALAKAGTTIWLDLSSAKMTMRPLSSQFINYYLDRVGKDVLASVGAYQIEGEGIQLFEKIDGDYFTIIGLPLLLLLKKLRQMGVIKQ